MKQELVVTVAEKELRIPHDVRPEVAARAALRNLPLFTLFEDIENEKNQLTDAIRSLISGLCFIQTEDFPWAALAEIQDRIQYSGFETYPEHRFSEALLEREKIPSSIYRSIEHTEENGLENSHFSALELDLGKKHQVSLNDRLWTEEIDDRNSQIIHDFLGKLIAKPGFKFWQEWYLGFLGGEPLDWELQRQVALIEDAIWEAGPEAIAAEIEIIRAKLNLEKRIEELEPDLRRVTFNRRGIGGNMPPEMLDDTSVKQELIIIWQPLEAIKEEIAKDKPDPERLQRSIEALNTALKKGFTWCLKKGDLVVDTAIKWAIPAGGTGYLALNPEKLQAVIEAAAKLLGIL